MDLQLRGRTALVTGASSGIGRAIARALAREGARVAFTGRRRALLDSRAGEVAAAGGERPVVIVHDAMDEGYVDAIEAGLEALGPLAILVNNAGGSRAFGLEGTEADWHEALTLNFTRHRQLTQRLLPQMVAGKWGRIINITGKSEPEGLNGAFAAKAAMHSWAKGLSRELGRHGITVNSIPPGRIDSEQIRRNYSPERRAREEREEIPLGEYGKPEDVANLVCFLVSPLARYITGTVIPVDGGMRRYQF